MTYELFNVTGVFHRRFNVTGVLELFNVTGVLGMLSLGGFSLFQRVTG